MYVYNLTGLTGRRKNADRVSYLMNQEVNRNTQVIAATAGFVGLIPGALLGLLLAPLTEYWWLAMLTPLATGFLGLWLLDQRARNGLHVTRYRSLLDSRSQAKNMNIIRVCGEPLVKSSIAVEVPLVLAVTPHRDAVYGTNVSNVTEVGSHA